MVKVGDTVFAKTQDAYQDEPQVRPGMVTRVFTEDDGEWAKDREIVSVVLFGGSTLVEALDMDKGVTDDDGNWVTGGWATSEDGPGGNETATADDSPTVVDPASVSGANTDTVGDGSNSAPVTEPV